MLVGKPLCSNISTRLNPEMQNMVSPRRCRGLEQVPYCLGNTCSDG